jgi:hypothetical protein
MKAVDPAVVQSDALDLFSVGFQFETLGKLVLYFSIDGFEPFGEGGFINSVHLQRRQKKQRKKNILTSVSETHGERTPDVPRHTTSGAVS